MTWILLTALCAGVTCTDLEMLGEYESQIACEVAMEQVEVKPGRAIMCVRLEAE